MQETPTKSRNEVATLRLLDELEEMIEDCMPLGKRALWVNVDEFFTLTNKIRVSLPQELRRAERFVRDGERLLAESRSQAERIVQEAQREADRVVQDASAKADQLTLESEITRTATAKAKLILQEAEEHARGIRRGADEYARDVLENLDEYVSRVASSIQRGREKLEPNR
jgi:cell division septum initiation protein DivIVA